MTDHPGEQPPAVDPDVEPGADPRTEDQPEPDYDSEPAPESRWVNPTLQGRPHTDPLLAGFTVYGDPTPVVADDPVEDTEAAFEASLEDEAVEEELTPFQAQMQAAFGAETPEVVGEAAEAEVAGDDVAAPEVFGASAEVATPRPAVPTPSQAFATPASAFPRPAHAPAAAPASAPAAAPASAPAAAEASEYQDGGHPLVEEVMARLDGLGERPVGEHADVYADLHERLQSALVEADADHGDRG